MYYVARHNKFLRATILGINFWTVDIKKAQTLTFKNAMVMATVTKGLVWYLA